jgi:DNA-binding beta-propeller fold protein YncE
LIGLGLYSRKEPTVRKPVTVANLETPMIKRSMLLAFAGMAAGFVLAQKGVRQTVARAPELPYEVQELKVQPPQKEWRLGMVSWIAVDPSGLIYLLQRGKKADPVVVVNRQGRVVRSWGKGLFMMPHAIRIGPQGNIWTTDAGSSIVYEFSPTGRKLMQIEVGGQPTPCRDIVAIEKGDRTPSGFCGTTDIAFARNGDLYITDGYANARVLEYTRSGRKVRQWGTLGKGPGQFRLPHSIQIDSSGVVYVSDRENGRVERFNLQGKYLGVWDHLGRVYSMKLKGDVLWLATQPLDLPVFSPGWILKLDRKTGRELGRVGVTGAHGMDALADGELFFGPGPNRASPQRLRPRPAARP